MSIVSITTDSAGLIGNVPRLIKITTTDNLATITAAGYLNNVSLQGYTISPTDVFHIIYSYVTATNSGTFAIFTCTISGVTGQITLAAWADAAGVTLPTIANHIATYTNTGGQLSEDPATAISGGNIQAGLSGTAGTLASFPATAANGSLVLAATNNSSGNFSTTISNAASVAQSQVISIPDVGAATGQFLAKTAAFVNGNVVKASGTAGLMVDAGFALHSGTTASYGGGGTSNTFATTNMTSASIVTAVILTSTNSVSITKAVPGTNTLTITFSADPGAATTVNWISVTAVA